MHKICCYLILGVWITKDIVISITMNCNDIDIYPLDTSFIVSSLKIFPNGTSFAYNTNHNEIVDITA